MGCVGASSSFGLDVVRLRLRLEKEVARMSCLAHRKHRIEGRIRYIGAGILSLDDGVIRVMSRSFDGLENF